MVIGAAIGGLLLAAPLGLELIRDRFRLAIPADRVSETVPWLCRGAGVAVVIFALVLGCVKVVDARSQAVLERDQRMLAQAEADFVPPAPEPRGMLPVVGYLATPQGDGMTGVTVFYAAPPDSVMGKHREFGGDGRSPCYAEPISEASSDGVSFRAELVWAPQTFSDAQHDQSCSVAVRHQIKEFDLGAVPNADAVRTDGPLIAPSGTVVVPAGPANAVPPLNERPETDQTTITKYDRGEIPIVGYQDDGPLKRLSFLVPSNANARAAGADGVATGGCEVVPVIHRVEPSSVTVGLRLVWSDPDGALPAEDDASCHLGTSWAGVKTARWTEIPAETTLLTNGPIVDPAGVVVLAAAVGNVVPSIDSVPPASARPVETVKPDAPAANAAPQPPSIDAAAGNVAVQAPNAAPLAPNAAPPAANAETPATKSPTPSWTMPDVRGMSLRQATNTLHALTGNEDLKIVANDVGDWHRDVMTPSMWDVCSQSPRAGASLTSKRTVTFIVTRRGGKCK
jgi:hypothetical protein